MCNRILALRGGFQEPAWVVRRVLASSGRGVPPKRESPAEAPKRRGGPGEIPEASAKRTYGRSCPLREDSRDGVEGIADAAGQGGQGGHDHDGDHGEDDGVLRHRLATLLAE